MDRHRVRTADDAPFVSARVSSYGVPFRPQLFCARPRNRMTDELRRIRKCWIVGVHDYLRNDCCDTPLASRATESVFYRLLDHVADPPGCARDQNAKRERGDLASRDFVSYELIPDLWTISVHDADVPSFNSKIDDRREALTRVPELVVDRSAFPGRRQCIAAERDDGGRNFLIRQTSLLSAQVYLPRRRANRMPQRIRTGLPSRAISSSAHKGGSPPRGMLNRMQECSEAPEYRRATVALRRGRRAGHDHRRGCWRGNGIARQPRLGQAMQPVP